MIPNGKGNKIQIKFIIQKILNDGTKRVISYKMSIITRYTHFGKIILVFPLKLSKIGRVGKTFTCSVLL
jgi:hypothetical protein